jgi:hypothetical protein
VKYKKNEAFVDVVETVNLSMSAKGPSLQIYHLLMAEDDTVSQAPSYGLMSMVTFKCARIYLAHQSASSASMTS